MKKKKVRQVKRDTLVYEKTSKVIRLSPELIALLNSKLMRSESFDNLLRRLLGLPANKYSDRIALTFWVIDDGGHSFTDEAVARGEAIRLAVKSGKKPYSIIKVREAI